MRQDNAGGTVVHHAIEKGQTEIIDILISNSVDIDISDNAGRTPLFEAVDNNHDAITSLLVKQGANVDMTNYCGHTPLYCAAREGNIDIVRILVNEGNAKIDHYGVSSVTNDFDDDDITDDSERCLFEGLKCSKLPLHVASLLGYEEIVKFIIAHNASPDLEGEQGYNSLHFSILGMKPEISEILLLETCVDPYHKD
jgi:ankyrin repeat protein